MGRRGGRGELLGPGGEQGRPATPCQELTGRFQRILPRPPPAPELWESSQLPWRLGLEFVGPGIAHSGGCQEVGGGRRPSWVDASSSRVPLTSCIPGAAGGSRGAELGFGVGRGCRGQGLFLSAHRPPLFCGTEECRFLSQPDPEDPTGRREGSRSCWSLWARVPAWGSHPLATV